MLLGQDLQATASSPRKGRCGPLDYIIPPMKRPPLAGWLRHAVRSAWSWITHAVRSAWSWITHVVRSAWSWITHAVPAWSWITILVVLMVTAVIVNWDWLSIESNGSTIRNIGLVAAAIIALPLAIWRSIVAERQAETAQRGLLNERYQKGADMLGSEKLTVRLGGIYALAWLAREYPGDYHTPIMSLFCVFVRPEARVREDVRAVMTAVGMRSSSQIETEKKEKYSLDLFGAHLEGFVLSSANLTRVRLGGANLSRANLLNTNLSGAVLDGANLSRAFLHGTDLRDCQGLTQEQLDQALVSKEHPPNLKGVVDAETGKPLVCS